MDHPVVTLPLAIIVIDCFLPAMAPVVVGTVSEYYDSEVVGLVISTMVAVAKMEANLN